MTELISLILIAIIGFIIGWKGREIHARRVIRSAFAESYKEFDETLQRLEASIVDVTIEDVNGEFFVYRADDNTYIAHAANKIELDKVLREKFPGKFFNVTPEHLEKLNSR